jgi:hypothetical protein
MGHQPRPTTRTLGAEPGLLALLGICVVHDQNPGSRRTSIVERHRLPSLSVRASSPWKPRYRRYNRPGCIRSSRWGDQDARERRRSDRCVFDLALTFGLEDDPRGGSPVI